MTPQHASVVVIGGGVIGLSSAYHLAAAGVPDVVLLERDALGAGSTARSAGGVRALFSDEINIRIGLRGLETFERFGADFGQEIDLVQNGYLFLLDNAADLAAFEAVLPIQHALGVDSRLIGPEEAQRLSPLIETDGLVAAVYSPRDGHCTPESVVQGYARAARRHGATIRTGTPAIGIEMDGDQITGVVTEQGTIATATVVCAAGAWSKQVAEWVGVHLPIEPLRRQIVVTEPIEGLDPRTPFTIDFGTSFYFHDEGRGLLLGISEPEDRWAFDYSQDPRWLEHLAEAMQCRVPRLGDVGLAKGWAGLYEMTPDHNAVIGEAEGIRRFLYAAGFSGHGFLMGPAVGEILRDLFSGLTPAIDVTALHARRFADAADRPEHNII